MLHLLSEEKDMTLKSIKRHSETDFVSKANNCSLATFFNFRNKNDINVYSIVDVHFKCGIRQKWEICATFKMRCCCLNFVVSGKRYGKSNFHISFTPSLISPTGTCEYLVLLWLCRKAYASYYLLACRFLRKPSSFISFFLLGNVVGRVLPKFVSTHMFVFF